MKINLGKVMAGMVIIGGISASIALSDAIKAGKKRKLITTIGSTVVTSAVSFCTVVLAKHFWNDKDLVVDTTKKENQDEQQSEAEGPLPSPFVNILQNAILNSINTGDAMSVDDLEDSDDDAVD